MIHSSRIFLRSSSRCLQCYRRSFATTAAYQDAETAAPPLLAKFRTDMKEALKTKDNTRLNVLRGVLTEITILEKRSEAIRTDLQLYKLLAKRKKTCNDAARQFQSAGREDLVSKENEQVGVLQGYLEELPMLSTDEVVAAIKDLIRWMQGKGSNPRNKNKALRYLFQEGGAFHNKLVDEGFVARTFQRLVNELPPWDQSLRERRAENGDLQIAPPA